MFVDSASRLQRPYWTRDKSAFTILGVVKHFVADTGVPRAVRTDNGSEYTNSTLVNYCNGVEIRRVSTAPYTPQQNVPEESGVIKAKHATRIEVNMLFQDIYLKRRKRVRDSEGTDLWLESVLLACKGFNRFAIMANSGMLSPHEVVYGGRL